MKLLILGLLAAIVLSGCADRIHIVCPDCTLVNDKYACTQCSVEGYAARFDSDILSILLPEAGRPAEPK